MSEKNYVSISLQQADTIKWALSKWLREQVHQFSYKKVDAHFYEKQLRKQVLETLEYLNQHTETSNTGASK